MLLIVNDVVLILLFLLLLYVVAWKFHLRMRDPIIGILWHCGYVAHLLVVDHHVVGLVDFVLLV